MPVTIDAAAWWAGHDDGLAGKPSARQVELIYCRAPDGRIWDSYSYRSGWIEGDAHRQGYRCACSYTPRPEVQS